jgi:hypothetical protein
VHVYRFDRAGDPGRSRPPQRRQRSRHAECTQPIELTRTEYERVRGYASRFIVALNHENPETESIVEQNERFAVVETYAGASSRIARETDPRSQQHLRVKKAADAGS